MSATQNKEVRKVLLIGGFGSCPSLRSYLTDFLNNVKDELELPYDICLMTKADEDSTTAVSSGAVLRALNMDGGPKRAAICSYGFFRKQPYNPQKKPGHRSALHIPKIDPFDGTRYVPVIEYFMFRGSIIRPVHRFKPITCCHVFEENRTQLLCEELLYVSDSPPETDYPLEHDTNKGAYEAGRIITDFTFLKDEGLISPIISQQRKKGGGVTRSYYVVQYDLVVIVEGRNLRYEARYPSGADGKTMNVVQTSIASAFRPGTG